MGLDWVLHRFRPRKGKSAEFERLMAKLEDAKEEQEKAALRDELKNVSHTPFEDIGAPQIGVDARATKYFRDKVFAEHVVAAKAQGALVPSFEEALAKVQGQYVLALASDTRGLAGGSFLVSQLDYGAGIIDRCHDLVGDLVTEAWTDHTAKEAADYARRLEHALKKAKSPLDEQKQRLAKRVRADPPGLPVASSGKADARPWTTGRGMGFEDQRNTVQSIIDWLKFWSKKGYGFRAWS
jgi:hypothetical protein